jgi:16S rRNA processing protein RimM
VRGRGIKHLVRIGRVGRPHGIGGGFSVSDPTERIELLDPGRSVWLGERGTVVSSRKGTPQHPLLEVEGVDDREAARALAGTPILAPRDVLGELRPGEYLVSDLIGLEVVDGEKPVGRVADVVLLPSVDALDVERQVGGDLLVPLVDDAIRSIDPEGRRIDVDLDFVEGERDGG